MHVIIPANPRPVRTLTMTAERVGQLDLALHMRVEKIP